MAKVRVKHVASRPEWKTPKDGSGTWIEYWEKYSGLKLQSFCRDCGKTATEKNPLVGAHIKKVNSYDNSIYIVPTCKSCNTAGATNLHEFDCDERALVPANKTNL